ncbi:hypothetical protein ATCC90586_002245 [Pythium insidiosum]|nr:hypothetical protein ATCC90586_002245 [Pythium insidiosum]
MKRTVTVTGVVVVVAALCSLQDVAASASASVSAGRLKRTPTRPPVVGDVEEEEDEEDEEEEEEDGGSINGSNSGSWSGSWSRGGPGSNDGGRLSQPTRRPKRPSLSSSSAGGVASEGGSGSHSGAAVGRRKSRVRVDLSDLSSGHVTLPNGATGIDFSYEGGVVEFDVETARPAGPRETWVQSAENWLQHEVDNPEPMDVAVVCIVVVVIGLMLFALARQTTADELSAPASERRRSVERSASTRDGDDDREEDTASVRSTPSEDEATTSDDGSDTEPSRDLEAPAVTSPLTTDGDDVTEGSEDPEQDASRVRGRRRAIGRGDKKLQKIATTAATKSDAAHESAKAKLLRAVAAMKGHQAFLNVKSGQLSALPFSLERFGGNAHQAFQEFKRQGESRARAAVSMTELNATTRTPIRFGDQICLLSMVSHLPLALGADGHTLSVANSVVGPHTIFTLLDFRDPSRRDDVLIGEDVWLRVDDSVLLQKEPVDDVLALIVDVHYFLGCPGWLEDAVGPSSRARLPPVAASRAAAYSSSASHTDDALALDTLKLAAMKAEIPAAALYGDDQATREVAVETNASVLRLAKWRFAPSRSRDASTSLVLNCATLCLLQSDFALEFDDARQRAVLRGASRRADTQAPLDVGRRPGAAWQLRLVARPSQESKGAPPGAGATATATSTDLEWLARHEEQVTRNARRIRDKAALASDARRAYDRVAQLQNAKLVDSERRKAQEPVAYFRERFRDQRCKD